MKKPDLMEMIRAVVAEEVRKQLPGVVSEMYLRKLVSEQTQPQPEQRQKSFEEVFEDEMQSIPEPLNNSNDGIYHKGPIQRKSEAVSSRLMSDDNPMAMMYEGVSPIAPEGETSMAPTTNIPLQAIPGMQNNFSKFLKPAATGPMQNTPSAEERRLNEMRSKLDAVVVAPDPSKPVAE